MEKALFLDIDGVLNDIGTKEKTPMGFLGLDDDKVLLLKKIISDTGAGIVLSSTWRFVYARKKIDGLYLKMKFKEHGMRITDTTLPADYLRTHKNDDGIYKTEARRGAQIMAYLAAYPEITGYAVLDDETFDFRDHDMKRHFVRTDFRKGLTEMDAIEAVDILNGKLSDGKAAEEDYGTHFGR